MTILICDECGNEFEDGDLISTYTAPEHHGASVHPDTVSPCCHADYDYCDDYDQGEHEDNPGGFVSDNEPGAMNIMTTIDNTQTTERLYDLNVLIKDHEREIEENAVLIMHLEGTIKTMQQSIKKMKLENNGHIAQIATLKHVWRLKS